jgi:hypothetical protein
MEEGDRIYCMIVHTKQQKIKNMILIEILVVCNNEKKFFFFAENMSSVQKPYCHKREQS